MKIHSRDYSSSQTADYQLIVLVSAGTVLDSRLPFLSYIVESVAIGDLNGDYLLDLAVANRWSDNVSLLINSLDRFETVYPKGWSMISLPVDPTDKKFNKLFPDAVFVYGYEQEAGCVRVKPDDDLEVGNC